MDNQLIENKLNSSTKRRYVFIIFIYRVELELMIAYLAKHFQYKQLQSVFQTIQQEIIREM